MSDPLIQVRPAEAADAPAVREVEGAAIELLRRVYRPTAAARDRAARRSASLVRLVAVRQGHLVGAVRYRIEGDRLHIIGLMVHPAHHRRGVAGRMVQALAEIARDAGLARLTLGTIVQTGNVPIFERLGFRVCERLDAQEVQSATGQPLTEARMERPVGPPATAPAMPSRRPRRA